MVAGKDQPDLFPLRRNVAQPVREAIHIQVWGKASNSIERPASAGRDETELASMMRKDSLYLMDTARETWAAEPANLITCSSAERGNVMAGRAIDRPVAWLPA